MVNIGGASFEANFLNVESDESERIFGITVSIGDSTINFDLGL